jgi:hypothetical protein
MVTAEDYFMSYIMAAANRSSDNECKERWQMTLWEFIDKLEKRIKKYPKATSIWLDRWDANITGFCSYRWDYRYLAMCYSWDYNTWFSSKELLEELKKCIWKTFEGWKWWDFVMTRDTYLFIANEWCTWWTYPIDIVWCDDLLQIRTEKEIDSFYEKLED